ncbi:hypothetical protein PM082_024176 [Marasmius tenuissimus]|nr:hypothetical protein PM082_024176 [Marasmius tenuissimus]
MRWGVQSRLFCILGSSFIREMGSGAGAAWEGHHQTGFPSHSGDARLSRICPGNGVGINCIVAWELLKPPFSSTCATAAHSSLLTFDDLSRSFAQHGLSNVARVILIIKPGHCHYAEQYSTTTVDIVWIQRRIFFFVRQFGSFGCEWITQSMEYCRRHIQY